MLHIKDMKDFDFVALDFETANDNRYSACQLAMIGVKDGRVRETFSEYIRPPDRLFKFTYIHGISYGDVEYQQSFKELHPEIDNFISRTDHLAAHNMPFDRDVFAKCCDYYGILKPVHQWNCTVQIAKKVWPKSTKMPNHKLDTVCARFGIQLNHHEALSDANAVVEIISKAQESGWKPPWGDKAPSVKTNKAKIYSKTIAEKSNTEKARHLSPFERSKKVIAESSRDGHQMKAPYKLFGNAGFLEGVIVEGRAYGQCVFNSHDGHSYDGAFMKGLPEGKGIYDWANGDRYEGDWLDGKRVHGCWETDEGERYVGEFQDGRFHGVGTWTYEDEFYEGDFKQNLRHGYGTYAKGIRFPSNHGVVIVGDDAEEIREYAAGSFCVGGTWEDDVLCSGKRTFYPKAGVAWHSEGYPWTRLEGGREFTVHEGRMLGELSEGEGIERKFTLAKDDASPYLHYVYEGSFRNGRRHGDGELTFSNEDDSGVVYCKGKWEDGALTQVDRLEWGFIEGYARHIHLLPNGHLSTEMSTHCDLDELESYYEYDDDYDVTTTKYKFKFGFVKGRVLGEKITKGHVDGFIKKDVTKEREVFVLSEILAHVSKLNPYLDFSSPER
jgi:DNA polymerase III subunit epsilon